MARNFDRRLTFPVAITRFPSRRPSADVWGNKFKRKEKVRLLQTTAGNEQSLPRKAAANNKPTEFTVSDLIKNAVGLLDR